MNKIAVAIYDLLKKGEFDNQDYMPSAEEFAERFKCDLQLVKDGIGDLIYEGDLERVPVHPDRVRIRKPYLWGVVRGNHSFTGEAKKHGQKPGAKILTFEKRPAWPQVAKRLGLEVGDEVNVMERLLFADETVVGLEFSYMPSKFYPGVERAMFEGGKSTFAVMEQWGHISAKGVDELNIATLEPREAELFGMDVGVPVLIRFRVTLNPEGVAIKGSRAIYLFNPGYELDI